MWELNCSAPTIQLCQRSAQCRVEKASGPDYPPTILLLTFFLIDRDVYKDRLPTKCADECLVARKISSANADVKITRELLIELKRAESQIESGGKWMPKALAHKPIHKRMHSLNVNFSLK